MKNGRKHSRVPGGFSLKFGDYSLAASTRRGTPLFYRVERGGADALYIGLISTYYSADVLMLPVFGRLESVF